MKRTLSLSFAFLAILLLNINAQENSATAIDSMENEILSILNNKTWRFYFNVGSDPLKPHATDVGIVDTIVIMNANMILNSESGIKSVNILNNHIGGSNDGIWIGDSLFITKARPAGKEGSKKYINGKVTIEADIKELSLLIRDYQQRSLSEKNTREWAEFEKIALTYHEITVKPVMTEEQRKFIVQANALNDNKSYFDALAKYTEFVRLNPVAYPPAYYNMALIAARIRKYDYAILNMKKYLVLVPDAEDARAAQDKIYEWELNK